MKIKNLRCMGAVLGMIHVMSLTGCGEKPEKSVLKGTVLYQSFVATVDGECTVLNYAGKWSDEYTVYRSVMSGELLTDSEICNCSDVRKVDEINVSGIIDSKLTPEELDKAVKGNLTEEDVANIIYRITQEQTKELESGKEKSSIK